MAELKLARLPDRTPVKLALTVTPDLDIALRDYLALYRAACGDTAATVADLIPAMLEAFLNTNNLSSPSGRHISEERQDRLQRYSLV